ncbi:MAG: bifunctional DNA primase/polymerase, partial [Rhodoferax sp.]
MQFVFFAKIARKGTPKHPRRLHKQPERRDKMESSIQSTNGVQQAAYTPHLIPTDQEQYALPERALAAPLQGVDSEVGTQPALSTAPVDCQVLSHTFASAGESALFCFQSGYRVVPFDPASRCPAMGFDEWLEGLSEEKVISHWEQYPDHDVGCLVDADSIVFSVEGQKASTAIREIESAHSVVPNMVVTTTTGVLHFVRCAKGTSAASESHGTDKQSGRIVVRTEDKLVMLPSCADYRVGGGQANGTSGSTEVSQAFIDAVLQYNASLPDVPADADAEMVAPSPTPVAASPTFSTTGPEEAGESGGVGVQDDPTPNGTASTGFTASAGPSLKNVIPDSKPDPSTPDAVDPTFSTTGAVEAGESGDIGIQAGTVPASTASTDFAGFEAPSLKNMNLDSGLPVPVDPTFSAIGAVESGEAGESGVQPAALVAVPTVLNDDQTFGYTWDDDVLTPKAAENPVITALRLAGLYLNPLGSGEHSVTCPWAHEHGDGSGDHATYYEPNEFNSTGGFRCQHPHLERHTAKDLLELLGVPKTQAMHKPLIRIITGDLHCVVAASEKVLEDLRRYYQAGGMLVSIITDPSTGDPRILPTTLQALTGALSAAAVFEKFDGRSGGWVTCDPPTRHVGILYKQQDYRYLSPLVGLARQPFFREKDGALVTQPGYDKASQRFGVFDPSQFVIPEPTKEAALEALAMLMELLSEFRFDKDCDRSAALSAIFTATVRPSLPQAPAFHVTSVIYGSGKSYLCKLISCFAGPADSVKISFATTSDEATKSLMSVLVKNPAVVEFDDMTTDWI